MNKATLVTVSFVFLSVTAFAQEISVGKSLVFPQVAAGGGWETILNLTNRGTTTYAGSLNLFNTAADGSPQTWSPVINGTAITNGQMNISISPGNTVTYTFTEPGGTQAGFCKISPVSPSDSDETSFVEGNLTYYVMSGSSITDSIGIEPSGQIFLATIPFNNFSSICLALANVTSGTASVH
jgi:hypothetical protein